MQFQVFQASDKIFRDSLFYGVDSAIFNRTSALEAFVAGHYELVGSFDISGPTMDVDRALEIIWRATNSVDSPWFSLTSCGDARRLDKENIGKPRRSLSVGDVVRSDNKAYIVASCGFELLAEY